MNKLLLYFLLEQNTNEDFNKEVSRRTNKAYDGMMKNANGEFGASPLILLGVLINIAGTIFTNLIDVDGKKMATDGILAFMDVMEKIFRKNGINITFTDMVEVEKSVKEVVKKSGLKVEAEKPKTRHVNLYDEFEEELKEEYNKLLKESKRNDDISQP